MNASPIAHKCGQKNKKIQFTGVRIIEVVFTNRVKKEMWSCNPLKSLVKHGLNTSNSRSFSFGNRVHVATTFESLSRVIGHITFFNHKHNLQFTYAGISHVITTI